MNKCMNEINKTAVKVCKLDYYTVKIKEIISQQKKIQAFENSSRTAPND